MSSSQPMEHKSSHITEPQGKLVFYSLTSVRTGDPDIIEFCRLLWLLGADGLDG